MAPLYANLLMGSLKQKLFVKAPHKPLIWWRYIDDIFMIWTDGTEKLQESINFLNQQRLTNKFTSEISNINISFFGVMGLSSVTSRVPSEDNF